MGQRAVSSLTLCCRLTLLLGVAFICAEAQTNVNVTTWHQDIPAICTGCVYRTGQNLSEGTVTNVSDATFGQYCYYDQLDGQVPRAIRRVTMPRAKPNFSQDGGAPLLALFARGGCRGLHRWLS
jgi:hypothetical protein